MLQYQKGGKTMADIKEKDIVTSNVIQTAECNITIKDTHIHLKSVFCNKVPLEKALENIAVRKLAKSRRKGKKTTNLN